MKHDKPEFKITFTITEYKVSTTIEGIADEKIVLMMVGAMEEIKLHLFERLEKAPVALEES